MNKNLPPAKLASLAQSLSGKECAFLVIGYVLQQEKAGKNYEDEIKTISSAISPYADNPKRKEFYFYYKFWRNLTFFCFDLQTCMLSLQIADKQLKLIGTSLSNSCINYHTLKMFHWIPKIFTEEDLDALYNKIRQRRLVENLPIKQVAKHEAFLKLQKLGFLSNDDYFDDVVEYFEVDSKKTKEKLVLEEAKRIKEYLDEENRKKEWGAIPLDLGFYKEYRGMDLNEIKNKIEADEKVSLPTKERVRRWNQAVDEELAKLQNAVEKGKLKASGVKDSFGYYHNGKEFIGKEGIIAASWYDYPDKHDKDFNTHLDNKTELVEFEEGQFLIAKSSSTAYKSKDISVCSAEKTRQQIEKSIKSLLLLDENDSLLDFTNKEFKKLFIERINNVKQWIQNLINHIEVVRKIEKEYLTGIDDTTGGLAKQAENLIQDVIIDQNQSIDEVVKHYNLLAFSEPLRLKDGDKYKLILKLKPDEKWVDEAINKLIDFTKQESGYNT